jgi:hypothetical protein
VWVPQWGAIASTDGTLAGTTVHPFNVTGGIDSHSSKLAGDTFYFISVFGGDKTLRAYHVPTGTLTEVYRPPAGLDPGTSFMTLHQAGENLLLQVINHDEPSGAIWGVHGTAIEKIADISDMMRISSHVSLNGVSYFTMAEGTFVREYYSPFPAPIGRISGSLMHAEPAIVKLWRTDGTKAGTGVVRTLWEGNPGGTEVTATLSTANGALVINTRVRAGIMPDHAWSDNLTTIWDDTLAYQPEELQIERDFANAKLINGLLRLNGTPEADSFRVYRPAGDTSVLVVEVNGVARSFAFNAVRRIVADLQDGNDRLEVQQELRLWTSVLGGDGADTILTGTGRDTIVGGSGPDLILSRGNADVIIGGGGRDRITGGQGDDAINGGTGHDSMIAGTGHDVLFGQNAVEQVFGILWDDGNTLEDLVLQSF